jgi:hypothetical protein
VAYLPNQQFADDELEKQRQMQQPTMGGGGGSFGSGIAPPQGNTGSAQRPQQQPQGLGRSAMQAGGSGFVNLDRFMSGAQMGQQQSNISNAATGFANKEKSAFNAAAEPLRQAKDESMRISTGGKTGSYAQLGKELESDTGFKNLQNLIGQQYTGPMQVDYKPGESAEQWRLAGNRDTVVGAMNPQKSYGLGQSALDQALMAKDAGTSQAIQQTKQDFDAFNASSGQEAKTLGEKAQTIKGAYDQKRQEAQDHLGKFYKDSEGRLARKVDWENKQDQIKAAAPTKTTGKDATGVKTVTTKTWMPGDAATASNTVSAQEQGRFAKLAGLLGTPTITQTDRRAGGYQNQTAPTYEQALPSHRYGDAMEAGKKSAPWNYWEGKNPGDQMATGAKMSPEQRDRYEKMQAVTEKMRFDKNGDQISKPNYDALLSYAMTGDASYLPPEVQRYVYENMGGKRG